MQYPTQLPPPQGPPPPPLASPVDIHPGCHLHASGAPGLCAPQGRGWDCRRALRGRVTRLYRWCVVGPLSPLPAHPAAPPLLLLATDALRWPDLLGIRVCSCRKDGVRTYSRDGRGSRPRLLGAPRPVHPRRNPDVLPPEESPQAHACSARVPRWHTATARLQHRLRG